MTTETNDIISPDLAQWIAQQKMFFVATAPSSNAGLINCSPKGLNTLRVLDPQTVAYLDYTGSGIETVAHVQENGRIVIMLCAFEGPPKIIRLQGVGQVHKLDSPRFNELLTHFEVQPGVRSIIEVTLHRVAESCGWGVPKFDYVGQRKALIEYSIKQGEDGLAAYREEKNTTSLDGLAGF